MPQITYVNKKFNSVTLGIIAKVIEIIQEYIDDGYKLTLRQLYYQFVSRGLIENTMKSYKRIGNIVNDGRLAGLIDWSAIEDRTRNLVGLSHWRTPAGIIDSAAYGYRLDKWKNQPNYIEVWIEKEALAGVFSRVCTDLDVPFFCCRGYTSQSEMWSASQRMIRMAQDRHQEPVILHFGDHDPSGIDMSRDIEDRLAMFGAHITFNRLALNMDQVKQYDPPPNPAKLTDSRCAGYIEEYGDESWELDALNPNTLSDLVKSKVLDYRDENQYRKDFDEQEEGKDLLDKVSNNWLSVVDFLGTIDED